MVFIFITIAWDSYSFVWQAALWFTDGAKVDFLSTKEYPIFICPNSIQDHYFLVLLQMLACSKCGSLVHTDLSRNVSGGSDASALLLDKGSSWRSSVASGPFDRTLWSCRLCDKVEGDDPSVSLTVRNKSHLKVVRVPASFRYLVYELACLNVHTQLTVGDLV